jgi:hypothetical protein
MRRFSTGATRESDHDKFDYEAFLSPAALEAFGAYMHAHRIQADGTLRDGDNWQKGIPRSAYMKSLMRHVLDLWSLHRGHVPARMRREMPKASLEAMLRAAACGAWFNVQGYLHELLKGAR